MNTDVVVKVDVFSYEEARLLIAAQLDAVDTVNATVTSESKDGQTVYTATVEINGNTYTDEKSVETPPEPEKAEDNYSISVKDGISVNFYVDTPYYEAEDGYLEYTYIANSDEMSAETDTKTVNVSELEKQEDGTRKLDLKIAPAQIAQVLSIKVYSADGTLKGEIEDSVTNYCTRILNNNDYAQYHDLAQAILNYGQLSKEYFSYDDGKEIPYSDDYKAEVTDNFRARAHAKLTQNSVQISEVTYIALLNPEFKVVVTEAQDVITASAEGLPSGSSGWETGNEGVPIIDL